MTSFDTGSPVLRYQRWIFRVVLNVFRESDLPVSERFPVNSKRSNTVEMQILRVRVDDEL